MLLCDIGNSWAKIYDGKKVQRTEPERISELSGKKVFYINVNKKVEPIVKNMPSWVNLADFVQLQSAYEGMGIDRKVLCSGIDDGVVVDAGSAITVDLMQKGEHKGGFIYPGLLAMQKSYQTISEALDVGIEYELDHFPQNTSQALGYGIFKPIILAIEDLGERVYITGGDGALLAKFIKGSVYDPLMIFKIMENIVQRNRLC